MPEELVPMSEGIEDPWVEDWTSEESPEPETPESIMLQQPEVSATAMSSYDNIGESATAETIDAYLAGKSVDRSIWMTVLHNSATPASSDKGLTTVKSFAQYHMKVRGWKAIGYHFVIDTKGTIWAGRKMSVIGAHAGSSGNPGSIGVCLVGNLETTDRATGAQERALAALHVALHDRFYGTAPLKIRFHREFMNTACPGKITQDEVIGWIEAYVSSGPKIFLDGSFISIGMLIDGTTYAPLRTTFERARFDVDWIGSPKCVINMTSPGKQTVPPPSSVIGTKSKPKVVLDGEVIGTTIIVNGGAAMVPARRTFEAAGFHVDWGGGNVYITSPK